MNLEVELQKDHSKNQIVRIADSIGNSDVKFDILIKIILKNKPVLSQRGAWVMSVCCEKYPELLRPYGTRLTGSLLQKVHPAIKRNILRSLLYQDIPVRNQGKLIDILFKLMASHNEPIAIRVFSMTLSARLVAPYPELKTELTTLIEHELPVSSPAFRSRAAKILQLLNRS